MNILIDADACPVIKQAEKIAKKYNIDVFLFCDTNHQINSEYSKINVISAGKDAVDFAIISKCQKEDIIITQDYGLAAIALAKNCYCINQNGMHYTNNNIDALLFSRHISKKVRNSSHKKHFKGTTKRTHTQDNSFSINLENLIVSILKIRD